MKLEYFAHTDSLYVDFRDKPSVAGPGWGRYAEPEAKGLTK